MKPVGWIVDGIFFDSLGAALNMSLNFEQPCIPLYTAPRELSDDEIIEIRDSCYVQSGIDEWEFDDVVFAREILKKASEK